MVADLTIKDVTKSVTFDLEYLGTNPGMQPGVTSSAFEAKTEIDRRDFNVNFNAVIGEWRPGRQQQDRHRVDHRSVKAELTRRRFHHVTPPGASPPAVCVTTMYRWRNNKGKRP